MSEDNEGVTFGIYWTVGIGYGEQGPSSSYINETITGNHHVRVRVVMDDKEQKRQMSEEHRHFGIVELVPKPVLRELVHPAALT
ncbi:343_t:CDS:2 [Paraglomus occultum]|uniref:343_t:CDS:1 n=1 Tax=Paraglomus occultum TaxID=144539 RepID=A0A9N8ZRP0_9GLOM|nr:343_t:CDS:2 [Paraglomus occultum]